MRGERALWFNKSETGKMTTGQANVLSAPLSLGPSSTDKSPNPVRSCSASQTPCVVRVPVVDCAGLPAPTGPLGFPGFHASTCTRHPTGFSGSVEGRVPRSTVEHSRRLIHARTSVKSSAGNIGPNPVSPHQTQAVIAAGSPTSSLATGVCVPGCSEGSRCARRSGTLPGSMDTKCNRIPSSTSPRKTVRGAGWTKRAKRKGLVHGPYSTHASGSYSMATE